MDLALELGMTVGALKRSMTEREFAAWAVYREKRMLPMRRMELMLAQVTQFIVRTAMGGNRDATLSEFLFDPKERPGDADDSAAEPTADEVAAQFGASVYRKKKGTA